MALQHSYHYFTVHTIIKASSNIRYIIKSPTETVHTTGINFPKAASDRNWDIVAALNQMKDLQNEKSKKGHWIPLQLESSKHHKRNVNEPLTACGPPGSTSELNVSVVVSPVSTDFRQLSSTQIDV
ncbi:PsbP domain-containing protein 7 chloroplastic [Bienertia sinuspersici]